jgi:hypothetical protein
MRHRSVLLAFVSSLAAAIAWMGCGSGEDTSPQTNAVSHTTTVHTTTKSGSGGAGGDSGSACKTPGGEVQVGLPAGKCDIQAFVKSVPGCNHKPCETCEGPLNCLPVCCPCEDGTTYLATGCFGAVDGGGGQCMNQVDVCADKAAHAQGCPGTPDGGK